jgi:sulfite reductase (NADPH) flavoprotein alpha-component
MLELSDRSRWLVGAVASTAAVSLWLARRRQFSAAVQAPGEPLSTSFEAYLKQAPPEPVQYATTSFEAYLKQPPTAAAAAAAAAAPSSIADSLQAPPSAKPVTILFGTEYGFSKEVAERAGEALAAVDGGAAFWPQLLDMADLEGGLPSLASCQALLLVCSTQGDGVPPTEARPFCDWLASAAAPHLVTTHFSVCALGDK